MKDIQILWESERLLVINKPAGVVVNRVDSNKDKTVQDWIVDKFGNEKFTVGDGGVESGEFCNRLGVVHRLDKETSGCLVIAKDAEILKVVMDQFRRREVKKEYLALVHGILEPGEGVIKLPIKRSRYDRKKQEVRFDGRKAETSWRVEKEYESVILAEWMGILPWGDSLSLVRLAPKTGRMHQIRVHLAHLGHPIFSDDKYLSGRQRDEDRKLLPHHFLHAENISFMDEKGERISVKAPLDSDEERLLLMLE